MKDLNEVIKNDMIRKFARNLDLMELHLSHTITEKEARELVTNLKFINSHFDSMFQTLNYWKSDDK